MRRLPKSRAFWRRANLIANGVHEDLPLDLSNAVLYVLVSTGRAIPFPEWSDWLQHRNARRRAQLMAGI